MPQGKIIKWFDDRGFGFISETGVPFGGGHFVHINSLPAAPSIGDRFTFDVVEGRDGRTQAGNLRAVTPEMEEADRVFGEA